jgi:hypothetical protein
MAGSKLPLKRTDAMTNVLRRMETLLLRAPDLEEIQPRRGSSLEGHIKPPRLDNGDQNNAGPKYCADMRR